MDFKKSKAKNKKYSVKTPKGNIINFGDKRYTQYFDNVLGLYKNQNNNDDERRKSYRERASKITNKKGELTFKNPEYANYYSYNFLW